MLDRLRRILAQSELFSFNLVRRDRWIAEQAATLAPGSRVLDVGAGSGPYRNMLAHCQYSSQDFVQLRGNQLRDGRYARVDYVCDAAQIPVSDGSFDAVLCTEVLEHHPEPIKVVHEFARILAPGGRLILTAPLGSGIHQEPYHYYGGFTPWWYEKFLPEAGFAKVHVEANQGSLRFFAQESMRFVRATRPFAMPMPTAVQALWALVWAILLPVLGLLVPAACKALDRFDRERRFTVGYHVTAIKARMPHAAEPASPSTSTER